MTVDVVLLTVRAGQLQVRDTRKHFLHTAAVGAHLVIGEEELVAGEGRAETLLGEIGGEGRPLALVAGQQLVSVARHAGVQGHQHGARPDEVVGRDEHVGDAEQQPRRAALIVGHGRHRVVGPVAERVSVDDEKGSGGHPHLRSTMIAAR